MVTAEPPADTRTITLRVAGAPLRNHRLAGSDQDAIVVMESGDGLPPRGEGLVFLIGGHASPEPSTASREK